MELSEGLEQWLDEGNSPSESELTNEPTSQLDSEAQPQGDANEANEQGESLESKLDQLEVEGDSQDVLGLVNDLGLVRKGMPFQYDDVEKLKADLMKGFDYSQKTMELADERKSFEQEMRTLKQNFESERKEFEETKKNLSEMQLEYEAMGSVMQMLQQEDPELFNDLSAKFNQVFQSYSRVDPRFNQVQSELAEVKNLLTERQQAEQQKQHEDIRTDWDNQLSETQREMGAKLRKLGIRPNWENVKNAWAKDPDGKMTVKQALLSVHGEEMAKAFEAMAKVNQSKKQSQARRGPDKNDELTISKHGSGTYLNTLEEIAARHGI